VTDAPNIPLKRAVPFIRHLLDLSRTDWFDAKPDRRSDGKHDKNRQNKQLREFEWRLGLCRSKRMQRRNFFKRLHHCDKKIEVETNHAADNVDPAPRPCEMLRVTRENRKCEERQRYDAETDGRGETILELLPFHAS
jgi:hypothetical protein